MAAKPVPDLALWTVQIAPGGVVNTNQYMKIGSLDTVAFYNGAAFPVNIVFTSAFSSILNLQPGHTSAAIGGGTSLNTTVNYKIYNASTGLQTGGPYAIEFGIGPLIIAISALNTSPDPIAIPAGGQIAFNADKGYSIAWKIGGNPVTVWSPQPTQVSAGLNATQTALAGANGQTLSYTIASLPLTQGGGTVKVGT